jgi:hypothetical protein
LRVSLNCGQQPADCSSLRWNTRWTATVGWVKPLRIWYKLQQIFPRK